MSKIQRSINYLQHGNCEEISLFQCISVAQSGGFTSWFVDMIALITREHGTCWIELEDEPWALHAAICITFNLMLLTIIFWWLQHCYVPIWHVRKKSFVQEVCTTYTFTHFLLCTLSFVFYLWTQRYLSCRAYVFFSSPVHKELVAQIKKDSSVLPRIGALSEVTWLSWPFCFQVFYRLSCRLFIISCF
jgi:hypothetical protein